MNTNSENNGAMINTISEPIGLQKYNTPPPRVSNKNDIDNPLLPREGIPITDDDFVDSSARIIDATNRNDTRFEDKKIWNNNVWSVDPTRIYNNSGLAGIDLSPTSGRTFDLAQFNKTFERNKEIAKENQRIDDLNKLNALSRQTVQVGLYDLPLAQIIINIKNTWFNLLDDLLDQKFELQTFTKENRLFYIGITILFFAIIMYLFVLITTDDTTNNKQAENIQYIYYVQYPETKINNV
jgi:hypothetical protein